MPLGLFHVTVISPSPGVWAKPVGTGALLNVILAVDDQLPGVSTLTARTRTSYSARGVRSVIVIVVAKVAGDPVFTIFSCRLAADQFWLAVLFRHCTRYSVGSGSAVVTWGAVHLAVSSVPVPDVVSVRPVGCPGSGRVLVNRRDSVSDQVPKPLAEIP